MDRHYPSPADFGPAVGGRHPVFHERARGGRDPSVADGPSDHGADRPIGLAVPADVHVTDTALARLPAGMEGVQQGENRAVEEQTEGDLGPAFLIGPDRRDPCFEQGLDRVGIEDLIAFAVAGAGKQVAARDLPGTARAFEEDREAVDGRQGGG